MGKHTILIVDDDQLILNTLKQRFDSWESEVYAVGTPEEAKQVLQTATPDIILLDLLLTKEDGSSGILDYIKSDPRLENVPVIALTNLDKPELKQMLLDQGVKEYWIKGSMSMDELYGKVMEYLEPKK
ncbi:MAG: response regulator [Candidatus Doudnabacteria bacterium]|nr:response regulator [Candidatus Doudnabacteria bacterium]